MRAHRIFRFPIPDSRFPIPYSLQPTNLGLWPRYANNPKHGHLGYLSSINP
ncbi:MAG: hypothetical protein F6K65_17960 [Moorea sp. SIO3C2]|nr:hypothetical protein [Moorena sp. SIO3C2]